MPAGASQQRSLRVPAVTANPITLVFMNRVDSHPSCAKPRETLQLLKQFRVTRLYNLPLCLEDQSWIYWNCIR